MINVYNILQDIEEAVKSNKEQTEKMVKDATEDQRRQVRKAKKDLETQATAIGTVMCF